MSNMNSLNGSFFGNKLREIDISRRNASRILNPSIRYYPVEDYNAVKPTMQVLEGTAVKSPEERRRTGTEVGAATADVTDIADRTNRTGAMHMTDAADKTGSSAGIQAPEQRKKEPCPNDRDFRLDFTDESLFNGIIMAEVLGKPKYFRKGRW